MDDIFLQFPRSSRFLRHPKTGPWEARMKQPILSSVKRQKKWAEAWYHSISPHCWLDSWYVSRYYLHYVWLINAIKKGTDIKTCRTFFSGGMNIYFSDQGSRALIGQIKLFGIFSHWFPCELLVSQNQWSSPSYKKYPHNIGWEVNTIP